MGYNLWSQNKCRSLWPIFHGPFILLYILKTVWWMSISCFDHKLVRYNLSLHIKCRSLWWYKIVQWFCLLSWGLCDRTTSKFFITSQLDTNLKINVGHCNLYFMVQWFYLISWRLVAGWASNFLAHLSRRLRMSYCDYLPSVIYP